MSIRSLRTRSTSYRFQLAFWMDSIATVMVLRSARQRASNRFLFCFFSAPYSLAHILHLSFPGRGLPRQNIFHTGGGLPPGDEKLLQILPSRFGQVIIFAYETVGVRPVKGPDQVLELQEQQDRIECAIVHNLEAACPQSVGNGEPVIGGAGNDL